MIIIIYIFSAIFGACIGSFLNLVIDRIPRHESILWPSSHCTKCNEKIKFYDNIPVISWLILKGKCRNCGERISIQHPIVEALSAIFGIVLCKLLLIPNLFLIYQTGVFPHIVLLYIGLLIFMIGNVVLGISDWKTTEIPPEVAIPIGILGIIVAYAIPDTWPYTFMFGNIDGKDAVIGAFGGGLLVFLIIAVYFVLTRKIGMGGGDIWMLFMIGGFLGWQSLIFVFFAASLQGIVVAVIAIVLGKKQQSEDNENALFRNRVADGVQAEVDLNESDPDKGQDKSNETDVEPDPTVGKLAVPFGPFLALSAIEYIFVGKYILPLLSGNMLTPWGLIPTLGVH